YCRWGPERRERRALESWPHLRRAGGSLPGASWGLFGEHRSPTGLTPTRAKFFPPARQCRLTAASCRRDVPETPDFISSPRWARSRRGTRDEVRHRRAVTAKRGL